MDRKPGARDDSHCALPQPGLSRSARYLTTVYTQVLSDKRARLPLT